MNEHVISILLKIDLSLLFTTWLMIDAKLIQGLTYSFSFIIQGTIFILRYGLINLFLIITHKKGRKRSQISCRNPCLICLQSYHCNCTRLRSQGFELHRYSDHHTSCLSDD